MAKRSSDAVDGAAVLASNDAVSDTQLDDILPKDGFEIVAPPSQQPPPQQQQPPPQKSPTAMTAAEVEAYFVAQLGTREEAFDVMRTKSIDELEDIQGVADDVRAGGLDDAAQQVGLDWSTLISTYIA